MTAERIVFVGRNTGYAITRAAFNALAAALETTAHRIVAVVVSDDDGIPSLTELAAARAIPVLRPPANRINAPAFVARLGRFRPTILLTVQFPAIYRRPLIDLPTGGCLNVHRGWPLRGGSIDLRTIFERRRDYAVVLHHIDAGIDTGNLIARAAVPVDLDRDDGRELDRKATAAGARLVLGELVPLLGRPLPAGAVQDRRLTLYGGKWTPAQKVIDPGRMTLGEAERLVRALRHPRETGAVLHHEGRNRHIVCLQPSAEAGTRPSAGAIALRFIDGATAYAVARSEDFPS